MIWYPCPDQARGTPSQDRGFPGGPPRKDMGPVEVLWNGDGVPPWKGHGTSGSIMGWRWGNPIPQLWTNKQAETVIFPHPSDAGGDKNDTINFSVDGFQCDTAVR